MSIIGSDIILMRKRYDEALKLRGIPAQYQYPSRATTNTQGEPVVDTYSIPEDTFIFFDSSPKGKTFKRLGWVVENSKELPLLIHCSFNIENLQKDCLFSFSGLYAGVPDRQFRVTEIAYDLECPDHLTCQVVPVYGDNVSGRTDAEVSAKFDKSNTFLRRSVDYRGSYYDPEDGREKG